MTNLDLIKKIKELDKIQPSQDWLDSTRNSLTSQIDFKESETGIVFGFFNIFKQPQIIALTMCLFLIILAGPWLTIKASQPSVPGDLLYSVKRASEGIQTTVASEEGKTQLQVKFAGRRLEELAKITEDSFSPDEKTEKAKQVIGDLKGNLADLSHNLDTISAEKIIVMAKKTQKIKQELDRTGEEVPADAQVDLAQAEEAAEELNQRILAVLIESVDVGQDSQTASSTLEQEILIFLEELEDGTMTTTDQIIR